MSPDGTRIAYRRTRTPTPTTPTSGSWPSTAATATSPALPHLSNWAPVWTPDGRLAFSRASIEGAALELRIMDADGTDDAGCARLVRVRVAVARLAARSAPRRSVGVDLAVVGLDGTRVRLTTTPVSKFGASWSPTVVDRLQPRHR